MALLKLSLKYKRNKKQNELLADRLTLGLSVALTFIKFNKLCTV